METLCNDANIIGRVVDDFMKNHRFDISQEEYQTLQRGDKDRFGAALFVHLRRYFGFV